LHALLQLGAICLVDRGVQALLQVAIDGPQQRLVDVGARGIEGDEPPPVRAM
jgi:hypothetical protein